MSNSAVVKGLLVSGLPHLLFGGSSKWEELRQAYQVVGEIIKAAKPDAIVYFSTQAVGVLGHSIQGFPNPKGIRVDENWYELGDIHYDFPVDVELAEQLSTALNAAGLQAKTLNYDHYPIDTGTLVAQAFLNPDSSIPATTISCNIYAGREDEEAIGRAVRETAEKLGKRIAVVAITGLSSGFFADDIDPEQDRISDEHDHWNCRILDLITAGKTREASDLALEFASATGADMQFKAFHWLMGALNMPSNPAKLHAYGPIWGSGAAIIEWY